MRDIPLWRRLLAELLGTGALVCLVVGSGIMAASLSPDDVGLQLLENSMATGFGLCVLIVLLGPVSGAHLNPVVTLGMVLWEGLRLRAAGAYVVAQLVGGVGGCIVANVMFDLPAVSASTTERTGAPLLLAEVVATVGLLTVILGLLWQDRAAWIPPMVGAYIAAAYWFTSSTSFANPAVTVGRAFTDTFAGIAPASVPAYVAAQLVGGGLALVLAGVVFTGAVRAAARAESETLPPGPGPGPGPSPAAGATPGPVLDRT
ncbi:aquaporin family protein [Phycicoccus sp. CSK15P-2]|uniref:aquaporin n=1 Tax=Phycicoccus sp. CSK15P-2 TaxID=2807627 RepID=UPI0019510666|nr:MIP/aquaporin family protein [Phycicoccus sp. CSK15P-2]MBM6405935.1 aquaporin family protein [Phycicoccus sp. CSK15P-2]